MELSFESIQRNIITARGIRVLLDFQLASLYGVTTARLNQQIRRNAQKFPPDFLFSLKPHEVRDLMLQNATSSQGHGGTRKSVFAFTEHGSLMAANLLNTPNAIQVSLFVVRAFMQMRQSNSVHAEVLTQLRKLEEKMGKHDREIQNIIDTIDLLVDGPPEITRPIGFEPLKKS